MSKSKPAGDLLASASLFREFSPEVERRRIISVKAAAEFKNISEDSFERHFGHLIRQITPRRRGVVLGDVLD